MEAAAFLVGPFAFSLIKLDLAVAMPARGAAARGAEPQRGGGLRMNELEAKVQALEARPRGAEGGRGEASGDAGSGA